MRILFLVSRFYPEIGGVERHTAAVASKLIKNKHSLLVITQKTSEELEEREQTPEGYEIVRLRDERLWNLPGTARLLQSKVRKNIKEEIEKFKPDVVHVHDVALWTRWWAPLQKSFPNLPAFITFHGWEGKCPPASGIIKERQTAEKQAKGSIAVGQFIEKWYGTKSDVVMYGGVDLKGAGEFTAKDTNTKTLASLQRALFLGRLAEDTGVSEIVDGWIQFIKTSSKEELGIDHPKLSLAGDGPLRDSILDKADKENVTIEWLGMVEDPGSLLSVYGLVFAGGYLSILEALSKGAVVCSFYNNELRKDYLECHPQANKLLHIAGSVDGIVESVKNIYAKQRTSERLDGREWAKGHTWQKVVESYEQLWQTAGDKQ